MDLNLNRTVVDPEPAIQAVLTFGKSANVTLASKWMAGSKARHDDKVYA